MVLTNFRTIAPTERHARIATAALLLLVGFSCALQLKVFHLDMTVKRGRLIDMIQNSVWGRIPPEL